VKTPSNDFADLVLESQRKLYGYILTLVPDSNTACDILQQTNVVLWRDSERFEEGTNFLSWAFRVAYFQVLDYREKRQRDRLRFSKELFDQLANSAPQATVESDDRLDALRRCLAAMPARQRSLVQKRYADGLAVTAIAKSEGQAAGTLATYLHRIRKALLDCIQKRLAVAEVKK